jgi:D-arabinitol 4-dehydrogenase
MTRTATSLEQDAADSLTWLHIGAGSFHRAHQAVYLNALRERRRPPLATGAGQYPRRHGTAAGSAGRQQGQYTLETVTPQGERSCQRIAPSAASCPGMTGSPS